MAGAAEVLQEVHVETYGALTKKEKADFILEQVRRTKGTASAKARWGGVTIGRVRFCSCRWVVWVASYLSASRQPTPNK